MLELSALGLLQREPLHGYRLKQQLELFMGCCISVNYGAIYPLLKRLEERGEIEASAEETSDAGPCRKTYSITAKGRASWRQQMLEHPQESWVKSRSRFMIKFFFFNDLEPAERIKLLEHRLMVCRLRQEYLENQEREHNPADPYQAAGWQRSLEIHSTEMQWLSEQLTKERLSLPAANCVGAKKETKALVKGKGN
ncbi:PadR family transcriptional regulator [Microcoleus sp. FACHB-672]|uniref:PadR family transcriptional regulator n=1 Tax=Microcoleus sp. FACHB-672 TaxID=2692825 RepID=UPI001681F322|nr:PadR family transcriptional regulator [Microcoleus sp. FACHB-672]MBD2041872.1 PadR family transcriptional regulator [Microcoleus sp. FACHB-672]